MLSGQTWDMLVRQGAERRYAAGAVMLRQGAPGTHLLALTNGLAKIVQYRPDGTGLWLAFRGPRELLGEVSVLSRRNEPRGADVVAVTECVTRVLDAARFRRFVDEHRLGADLLQQAMDRTRESDEHRAELVTLTIGARLARTLLRLSALAGSPHLTGLTQEELAQAIGGSRNGVADELQRLRAAGAVATARKVISILDPDALCALAGYAEDGACPAVPPCPGQAEAM
ncbi:Crp/Fnr family transcriptional regulator [Streptomyces marincola]|uniref:Crp/Fnr family transcriptional regulator n=1 Tax=Streptomyces marincola TaxID=2878388 RepID=UPI00210031AE|nr:Crp/Fnr family transcriptional regulator [Streptomyces marincola]